MNKLLNISERVNIAIHALAYIAASDRNASVKRMAKDLKVSETYLAKVLQPLVKEKLIHSKRGARGGFTLAKKPGDITAYDLVTIIEGPLPVNACLFLEPICDDQTCRFRALTTEIRALLEASLRKIKVSDIMKNFKELEK